MKKDLAKIKKLYGEDFAKKFCRKYFSHILEKEDFSFTDFLVAKVYPSKFFYEDLNSYKVDKETLTMIKKLSESKKMALKELLK